MDVTLFYQKTNAMTIEQMFEYRRWAASMFEETKQTKKVDQYYYLQEWLDRFDKLLMNFTCYPDHHCMYKEGFNKLNQLCLTL